MSCRAAARAGAEIEVRAPHACSCVCSMSWRLHAIDAVTASARWRGGSRGTHAGSSDPCAFLNLDGEKRKSRVVKKNINPQWMQTFRFPCDDGLNVTSCVEIDQCATGEEPASPRHRTRRKI